MRAWIVAAALGVLLAAVFAGSLAPILLAAALPAALALSPAIRREAAFAPWIVVAIPAALGFWGLAAGKGEPWPFAVVAIGVIPFVRAQGRVQVPLVGLAILVSVVAYLSSGHGGSGPMIDWYERYGLTKAQAELLTVSVRKTIHFTFYGTVAWTALTVARRAGAEPKEAIRTALLAALAVAAFDETRQLGYANRSGSPWDVLLDLSGGLTFVGLSEWTLRKGR